MAQYTYMIEYFYTNNKLEEKKGKGTFELNFKIGKKLKNLFKAQNIIAEKENVMGVFILYHDLIEKKRVI